MSHSLDIRSMIMYDDSKLDYPVGYIDGNTGKEIIFECLRGKLILKYFPSQEPVWTDMGYLFIDDLDSSSGRCNMEFSDIEGSKKPIKLNWTNLRMMKMMPVPV